MPDTETIELRTDTVEELIDRLDYEIVGRSELMPRRRREAVQDRLQKQISKPDAVALCGLPAAGKSRVAEMLADVYDSEVVSMGDAIRENHPDDNPTSENLGTFASSIREKEPKRIPCWVLNLAKETDNSPVIIDGVRSVTDYEVLADYFDDFYLIEVEAGFYARLERLQDRGREGEDEFDATDLAERDLRERRDLGLGHLRDSGNTDMKLTNGTGPDNLVISLSSIVENNLPFEIQNGKPLGLNDEMEAFRTEELIVGGGPVGET